MQVLMLVGLQYLEIKWKKLKMGISIIIITNYYY